MQNAILIIAHKNKEQLIRLIKILNDKDFDIYIHLDKKWKLSLEEINDIKFSSSNVKIINKRISGFLDTWSLCQITIELAKEAFKKKKIIIIFYY